MAARRLSLLVLLPACAALRAPPAFGSVVAVDLLARAAEAQDVPRAWKVLRSEAFDPEWLTAEGTSGETALQAALRSCCAELVALIMMHPEFDGSLVKKMRHRKDLTDYAFETSRCHLDDISWAVTVMLVTYESKPAQDELNADPLAALRGDVWFLPAPGEWQAPADHAEMGTEADMAPTLPARTLTHLLISELYSEMAANASQGDTVVSGQALHIPDLEKLWCLLIRHVQTAPGSEPRRRVEGHLRSLGWSLFFRGAKSAMLIHYFVLDLLAMYVTEDMVPSGEKGEHEHLEVSPLEAYRSMPSRLRWVWQHIGTWVSMPSDPTKQDSAALAALLGADA